MVNIIFNVWSEPPSSVFLIRQKHSEHFYFNIYHIDGNDLQ